MKKTYKIFGTLLAATMLYGCGSDFLDTEFTTGVGVENGLNNVTNIETATNGVYYRLFNYRFAGAYAINIGDLAGDMVTFNDATSHWANIYKYTVADTNPYLNNIWNWGYKTVDNAARVIAAATELIEQTESEEDRERLMLCIAQASALKGLATLYLTNIFGLPVKVNGTSNGSTAGVVAVEEPIVPFQPVQRTTVDECYQLIVDDLERAIETFEELGYDQDDSNYIGLAAAEGILARTLLYMEDYANAKVHARNALDYFEGTMIYDRAKYKAMYQSYGPNSESIFKLAIDASENWSANSSGTLYTTYGYSPSFAYEALIKAGDADDIRDVLLEKNGNSYLGGKFMSEEGAASATHFMVRIPEMYLIIAESELKSTNGDIAAAQDALLNVAKRNLNITSTADLPSAKNDLITFLEEERARELFQEGHRFYDLRRWGKSAGVFAGTSSFNFTNYDIAKFCFPIPNAETRGGFGVVQTDRWFDNLPK